ncbi:Rap1a/Tai family immunity protein [Pseudomonas fluorescens]|uniref:Rap1a/Tai family immunity protein n=1 Tax=Pseudomonas fluorescens TaxID=294 RepID=UPI0012B9A699|nr:Rap1a/Tai family immunity protein [Pseudomonas fluorescens]
MKVWTAWLALVGVLVGSPVLAETIDGNVLLRGCRLVVDDNDGGQFTIKQGMDFGYCIGVLEGVRVTMMLHNELLAPEYKTCFPKSGIINEQATRIIVKYLNDHPADLHKPPSFLTLLAFKDAYPCK